MTPMTTKMKAKMVTMVISRAQNDSVSKGTLIRGVLLFLEFIPHIFRLYLFPSFRYFTMFTPSDTEEELSFIRAYYIFEQYLNDNMHYFM